MEDDDPCRGSRDTADPAGGGGNATMQPQESRCLLGLEPAVRTQQSLSA